MAASNELLIEQVLSAHRPDGPDGGPRAHPAWHDLGAAERRDAFDQAAQLRRLEAAMDPEGLSTTARAVLARLRK